MGVIQLYLILYNLVSAAGWAYLFYLFVVHLMGVNGQGPDPAVEFYGFSFSLSFDLLLFVFYLMSGSYPTTSSSFLFFSFFFFCFTFFVGFFELSTWKCPMDLIDFRVFYVFFFFFFVGQMDNLSI